MSKLIYSKAPEQKREVQSKPLATSHSGLMITAVVVVAISLFIVCGFIYLGYISGHYSQAYVLCKDDVLDDVRTGVYPSVNEIASALKTCDGT